MPQGSAKFSAKPTGKSKPSTKKLQPAMKKGALQIAPKKQKLIQAKTMQAACKSYINKRVDEFIMTKGKDERLVVAKDSALQSTKQKSV